MVRDGLERLQRAAHARRRGSAGSTSASCRARAAATSPASSPAAEGGEIEVRVPARRRRVRHRRGSARPSWSIRATTATAARTRADVILPGAAYTEKNAHLRQHRGPGAARPPRRLPAGRGARGLDDPARAVASVLGKHAALRHARRSCARGWSAVEPGLRPRSTSVDAGGVGRPFGDDGRARPTRRSRSPIANFYLTDPISRASRDHGASAPRCARARRADRRRSSGDGLQLLDHAIGWPASITVGADPGRSSCRCCWPSPT